MKSALFILPVAALALASCGSVKSLPTLAAMPIETTQTTQTKTVVEQPITEAKPAEYTEYMVRVMEPKNTILTTPIVADIIVTGSRISYTETSAFADVDVDENITANISQYKHIAYAKAAALFKADILVAPSYVIETKDGHLSITVFGYPANYQNFRPATDKDIEKSVVLGASSEAGGNPNDALKAPAETLKSDKQ